MCVPPIRRCFSAAENFAPGSSASPRSFGGDPQVAKMIAFIRAGKRPLTMAVKRAETDEDA